MNDARRVETPEGVLVVSVRGTGPAVLCLHGISANRQSWEAVANELATELTVVAPDLLGRGDSTIPTRGRYRLADEVRRVADLIRRLRLERFIVVGHSAGASIALGLTRRDAGVAGLVLVNPVTPWSKRPRVLDIPRLRELRIVAAALTRFRKPITRYILERRVLGAAVHADAKLIDRYARCYSDEARARALLAVLVDWQPAELIEWLPNRPVRSVVLTGQLDHRMPAEETMRLAERIGASHVSVPGAGHSLPDERPEVLAEAIREIGGSLELPPYTPPTELTSA